MISYIETDAKCPFFDKAGRGFVQCEGITTSSHTRTLFHDLTDGHPLDEDRNEYLKAFCNTDYKDCSIYKMLMTKYEEQI